MFSIPLECIVQPIIDQLQQYQQQDQLETPTVPFHGIEPNITSNHFGILSTFWYSEGISKNIGKKDKKFFCVFVSGVMVRYMKK